MTYTESELYPSFEDFMREDKLPPVFPSSQSSVVSETQVYSQHLISEVCDREIYGPFGINGINDNELPPNFINSSLAYSPKSIPPLSPSIDNYSCNMTATSSSTLDPLDTETDADEIFEGVDVDNTFDELAEEDILLDNNELMEFLNNAIEEQGELTPFVYEVIPTPSISPSPSITPSPPSITPSPSVLASPPTEESGESISNGEKKCDDKVKKPTRGRKRKLFTNCEEKKKDQNKEAARRYREKKKNEDTRLEAEEAAQIELQKKLRKELDSLTRAHKEILLMYKAFRMAKRQAE